MHFNKLIFLPLHKYLITSFTKYFTLTKNMFYCTICVLTYRYVYIGTYVYNVGVVIKV